MYRPVNGRVLPMDTAVFTARVRCRVPCTCTCLRPVYTAVHGRVQTAHGPCTWCVHDPNAAAAPTRPCFQPVPCTRPFTACTDRVHHDTVHSRHRKSWQQKLVGRLLRKSNNSFSGKRLVYVFGSRDLLGHNVGHVIAHAQLTLNYLIMVALRNRAGHYIFAL